LSSGGVHALRSGALARFIDGQTVIGDLRYDREVELSFAELELSGAHPCPQFVPPWIPPRSDLLEDEPQR
jgi:hypothetical protein